MIRPIIKRVRDGITGREEGRKIDRACVYAVRSIGCYKLGCGCAGGGERLTERH